MAVMNRNSLVLTGVSVVRDVVTCTLGNGGNPARLWASVSPIPMRRSSQRLSEAYQATEPRLMHASFDADCALERAGRPESLGRLAGRKPALASQRWLSPVGGAPSGATRG
jgi:hypothetical protein